MHREIGLALLLAGGWLLGGCESLQDGSLGQLGQDVFGNVMGEAAGSASVKMVRETADSMCRTGDDMCRNLTTTAMTGFTQAFIKQLQASDVRRINEARDRSIATGEDQTWENPETGASGKVSSEPAPPRPAQPTPVTVKKDQLKSLPMMDAVGEPYVVTASGGANVRGGPGTSYAVVDTLGSQEKVQAIGKVHEADWYLVGRGSVGIGYVFGNLLDRWTPPKDQPLDESPGSAEESPPSEDVTEASVDMASECYTTTQTVTLANGTTEDAKVTSCRTPNGWTTV
jgi:uncharacterized protein YgiM (DUF1202 family)